MPKDFSHIQAERDTMVLTWGIIESCQRIPHSREYAAQWERISFQLAELSTLGDGRGEAQEALARGVAWALGEYIEKLTSDFT